MIGLLEYICVSLSLQEKQYYDAYQKFQTAMNILGYQAGNLMIMMVVIVAMIVYSIIRIVEGI